MTTTKTTKTTKTNEEKLYNFSAMECVLVVGNVRASSEAEALSKVKRYEWNKIKTIPQISYGPPENFVIEGEVKTKRNKLCK